MVRRLAYALISLFLCSVANAGNRYALTVFISEYPDESGWNRLNSSNDKDIILPMLYRLGYEYVDIICLEDADATYDNIINALQILTDKVSKGDIVYVHFSCHGQQITDIDRDESITNPKDRYDESLVPYDACVAYNWNGYKGDRHLLDDTLNLWLSRISSLVGKEGSVIMVADACHSGDLQRTKLVDNYSGYRGTFDRFELPLPGAVKSRQSAEVNWVTLSACKDFQTNFECESNGRRYGRLSLAVSRTLKAGMTAEELMAALKEEYANIPLPNGKAQSVEAFCPKNRSQRVLIP